MGEHVGREAVFAHPGSDCITQTAFQHSPLLPWTLVCRASKAPATGRGETAERVYLNLSIIPRSNKHRTLGGDRFVISNPNVCTHVFRRIMLPSLKEKTHSPGIKSLTHYLICCKKENLFVATVLEVSWTVMCVMFSSLCFWTEKEP